MLALCRKFVGPDSCIPAYESHIYDWHKGKGMHHRPGNAALAHLHGPMHADWCYTNRCVIDHALPQTLQVLRRTVS